MVKLSATMVKLSATMVKLSATMVKLSATMVKLSATMVKLSVTMVKLSATMVATSNLVTILSIYLNTVAQGIVIGSANSVTLQNLAIQNPFTSGSGVYWARVMLNVNYPDIITAPAARMAKPDDTIPQNNVVQNNRYVNVMPNPANDFLLINYFFGDNTSGIMEIYNINGQKCLVNLLSADESQKRISTSMLGQGVYFYRILLNGEAIETKKLVIIKE